MGSIVVFRLTFPRVSRGATLVNPEIVSDQIVMAASIVMAAVGLFMASVLFGAWRLRSRDRRNRPLAKTSIQLRAVMDSQSATAVQPESHTRLDQRSSDVDLVRFI